MKFSISLFSLCILSFIIVFSCSTEEVQDATPPPSIIQNPEPESESEDETQSDSESQPTDSSEEYYSVNYEGNGTFTRYGAPYPPMESYGIELIEGEVNDDGEYLNGSTLRFTYQNNPGWRMMMEYKKELYNGVPKMSIINDFEENVWSNILNGNNFIIDENMTIPINVWATGYTNNDNFPWDQIDSNGDCLNVGSNLMGYPDWYGPSDEENWYVTDGFSWPGYIEAYKDRIFQLKQVVGNFGPIEMVIFDKKNTQNNRELFEEVWLKRGINYYNNQIWGSPETESDIGIFSIASELENFDQIVSNGGYPIGNADANMGGLKINWEYFIEKISTINTWAQDEGISDNELMQSDHFHWDWVGIHEPLHLWQAGHDKHRFWNEIGGNLWQPWKVIADNPSYINKIFPRWYSEGHIIVLEAILDDKLGLREIEQEIFPLYEVYNDIEVPDDAVDIRWILKNRTFRRFYDSDTAYPARLERNEYEPDYINYIKTHFGFIDDYGFYDESLAQESELIYNYYPKANYINLGIIACHYMLVKMNFNFDSYLEFDEVRGGQGFDVAMLQFLGLTEQQFYDEFNSWFFDSGLTDDQKIDYLWPEGTDPIQIDIQSRR